ncbi:CDK-activating kinase assembly factor MAT1-like [Actinia tenebrosa]|uniref:CDK-activating kinase assembly factor MAT1 n=1 Tax=Actinia tenebrosa TaxID=6105 RepID=A0A6P8IDB5_ACTTE|nr:CDK-activating kinase assembly factor MAT1-like [Actinia tenebrosa]
MEDQICPRCKTTKYRNPKLKLMVNVCGHKLCDTCVDLLFTRPSAACPECSTPLRRSDFRAQQFEDLIVEKEVDIRKKIIKIYNKREEDFQALPDPLRSYNDYLEDVETIVWNLANGVDVDETKKAIEKYKKENEALIRKNNVKLGREEAVVLSQIEEDEKAADLRRKQVAINEIDEKRKKKMENESFLNNLIVGDRPLDEIVSEHSSKIAKKQSVLFSSAVTTKYLQPKDEANAVPFINVPLFKYVEPDEENDGLKAPKQEVLASRGYLKNIRATTDAERAGGYNADLGCGRAIQDAFSALYLNL